ncbi:hypothetical protein BN946_scf184751.g10 [Trametes cinnabarina]|uniref:HTH CENPB-type domain-containing protein n=1 Tax=Pycnoporus cinnabarinus TaxID=5643 RepID=A0A060SV56_PYCCI|nr:hypothetical protein BN946_scf184751.g10 [Trametes cinnabarina]
MVNTRSQQRSPHEIAGSKRLRHRQIRSYTEDTLEEACKWLDENPGKYKAASELFGIPHSTLHARYLHQRTSRQASHAHQQLLVPEEEDALCDWIEHLSYMGFPVDRSTVFSLVMQITGESQPPSHKWIYRFLKRHPGIQLGKPAGLSPERAQAFNRPTVDDHFKKLKAVIDQYNIPWSHIYNMDEKGIQRGGGRRLQWIKYFVPRGRRVNYKLHSANLELITIIECVSADGGNILPGFIFAGSQFEAELFKDVDPRVVIAHSPNRWTDSFLCIEWFRKCFIPQANARRVSDAPVLLILDGHNSHITAAMRQLAIENNIHIFQLPPHTTHRLQPLDVGVFTHLQEAWLRRCNQFYNTSFGREMSRSEFIREYLALRCRVFKASLIKKAWYSSGITSGTWSADFFDEADFAPSYTTSTQIHVPPSYPHPPSPAPCETSTDPGSSHDDSTESNTQPAQLAFEGATAPLEHVRLSLLPDDSPPPCSLSRSSTLTPWASNCSVSPSNLVFTSKGQSKRTLRQDHELQRLEKTTARLEEENAALHVQIKHARAHAAIALWHLSRVQHELNRKKSSRKRRAQFRTTAALITAGEGAEECAQLEREAAEREQQRQAEQQRKLEREHARQAERERIANDDHVVFSGALSRKVKDDLKDIAFTLGLPTHGTNAELCKIITTHLQAQSAQYCTNPRFAGLFIAANGLASAQKRALPPDLQDENNPPTPHRRRTESPSIALTPAAHSHTLHSTPQTSPPSTPSKRIHSRMRPYKSPPSSPLRDRGCRPPAALPPSHMPLRGYTYNAPTSMQSIDIPIDPVLLKPDLSFRYCLTPSRAPAAAPDSFSPSRLPLRSLPLSHTPNEPIPMLSFTEDGSESDSDVD